MKIIIGYILLAAACSAVFIVSCKNQVSVHATKKLFVGKWKIVKISTEEGDGAIGAVDDNNVVVTFDADGRGSSSSVAGGNAFTWTLADDATCLNIVDSGSNHPMALLLTKTTNSSFTVKDTSTHPAQWETFNKQNDK